MLDKLKTPVTKQWLETCIDEHESLKATVSEKKYQHKDKDEQYFTEVLKRVVNIFEESVDARQKTADVGETIGMIIGGKFLPAGSILSGLGNTEYACSLSNCYLTKLENDSLESIFDAFKKLARTYSYRGGSGIDITVLRPKKARVNNAALTSSGAVSFMPIFSSVTEVIGQMGRRGALLISMDVRHPDILSFVWVKANPESILGIDPFTQKTPDISGANISVKVTDEFMEAVAQDDDWNLIFPDRAADPEKYDAEWDGDYEKWIASGGEMYIHETVRARDLFRQIAEAAWQCGDPGMLFIDTVQRMSPGTFIDEDRLKPMGVNPCVPPYALLLDKDRLRRIDDPEAQTWTSWKTGEKEVIRLHTNIGLSVDYTPDHELKLVDGSFRAAKDCVGEKLSHPVDVIIKEELFASLYPNIPLNTPIIVTGYESLGVQEVWDFKMKEPPNYNLCQGVIAHNCGEQALGWYNNCLLGAFALHKYVENPWSDKAEFDDEAFISDVYKAVLFMDTMAGINQDLHPLLEQREADKYGRRIGIEVTGLGDALAMLGIPYGSEEALGWIDHIFHEKAIAEIEASNSLAMTLGPCPAMKSKEARKQFLDSPYIQTLGLSFKLQGSIVNHGLRNTAFNTMGPCGSLSIVAGNCTSGMEPPFAIQYRRKTRLSDKEFTFVHQPILDYLRKVDNPEAFYIENLKDDFHYVESHELHWSDRIEMQAAVQKYTDASISSTINLSANTSSEVISDIYLNAWEKGLKGVTVFRDGCKEGVLSLGSSDASQTKEPPQKTMSPAAGGMFMKELLDVERAERHRVLWKGAKMYIIISIDDDDRPVEVFVKLPREAGINGDGIYSEETYQEKFSLWESVTRLASLLLRTGMPIGKIIKQLDKSSYSVVDASAVLARVLRKYQDNPDLDEYTDEEITDLKLGIECRECHEHAYVFEGGCGVCKACGYTDCG